MREHIGKYEPGQKVIDLVESEEGAHYGRDEDIAKRKLNVNANGARERCVVNLANRAPADHGYADAQAEPADSELLWCALFMSGAFALVVLDAVVRLLPGALGDERSSVEESFEQGLLDWPHYTRPEIFEGMPVPEVLRSGRHADIRRWRLQEAVARTWMRRPDLIAKHGLAPEASGLLNEFLVTRNARVTLRREGERHEQDR